MSRRVWIIVGVSAAIVVGVTIALYAYYLIAMIGAVQTEWGELNFAYLTRANLVPGLLGTTRSIALHNPQEFDALKAAYATVAQYNGSGKTDVTGDPQPFAAYVAAQKALTSAIYSDIAVGRRDPVIKYDQGFVTIQNELDLASAGIERSKKRYDNAARTFNEARKTFPDDVLAKIMGKQYRVQGIFAENAGAKKARPAGS
jgi:LemA protein